MAEMGRGVTRGLATLRGIATGMEKASANLMQLQVAKYNLEKQKQIDDLDIKSKKLELDKAELLFDPEMIKGERELLDSQIKLKKQAYNYAITLMDAKEKENKGIYQNSTDALSAIAGVIDLGELGLVDPTKIDQKKIIQNKILAGTATPEEIARFEQVKEVAGNDLKVASGLRQEFNQSNIFKNYQTVEGQYKGLQAAYQLSLNPDNASRVASDQALIVTLNKMLDPTSVVRESEYARTPEGVGMMNRLQSILPKLQKGGQGISNEDRKAVYDMAQQLLTASQEMLNTHIDRYENLAKLYGIDPQLIMGGITKFDVSPKEQPQEKKGTANAEIKDKYNLLREKGLSSEEAKKILGL